MGDHNSNIPVKLKLDGDVLEIEGTQSLGQILSYFDEMITPTTNIKRHLEIGTSDHKNELMRKNDPKNDECLMVTFSNANVARFTAHILRDKHQPEGFCIGKGNRNKTVYAQFQTGHKIGAKNGARY